MTYWADFIQKQKIARKKDILKLAGENLVKALNGELDEVGKGNSIQWRATQFVLEENFGRPAQNINLGAGEKPVIVKIILDKKEVEEAGKRIEEDEKSKTGSSVTNTEKVL